MKLYVEKSYEAMSKRAAEDLLHYLQSKERPLICPASGDTPTGLYEHLVQLIRERNIDISRWFFVALDEWQGMNGSDEGSCRYMLDRQLFYPLQVSPVHICFFDGKAENLQAECERTEEYIRVFGGIDLAIVGIGRNGHIGMNEPGTATTARAHVARLLPDTQQVGQKYFSTPQQLAAGVTLGLATILESKAICLLANGRHKADIVRKMLKGDIHEAMPASLLRTHTALTIYLDTDAASLIG